MFFILLSEEEFFWLEHCLDADTVLLRVYFADLAILGKELHLSMDTQALKLLIAGWRRTLRTLKECMMSVRGSVCV